MECLTLKKSNCRNCHKCIRNCPVKSIRFSGNQAYINENECILCGHCFVVCPQDAKQIVDSTPQVEALLQGSDPVYVSLAPSFIANYDGVGIEVMREALMQLGFAGVEETAVGATLVKQEYDRLLDSGERDIIISSCCHSVNLLIQKYYPSLLTYLADVLSPMQAHAQDIKRRVPGAKVVFVGPCVAKKDEAQRYPGYADAVLTFDELTAMLNAAGITLRREAAHTEEGLTRFFPTPGGVLRTMRKANPDYAYMAVDGPQNCIMVLDDIRDNRIHHCFIEMNICAGACVGGPVMEKHDHAPVRDFVNVSRYAGTKDFAVETPQPELLRKTFPVLPRTAVTPTEQQITAALQSMGKFSRRDELNCGTCGYNTCREKAIAICQGKAEVSMCLPFLMARSEGYSDIVTRNMPIGLIVTSETLEVQQVNPAALKLLGCEDASEVLGEDVSKFLDPMLIVDVLATGRAVRNQPMHLAAQDRHVRETVVYDREFHMLVCLLRDVTQETREQERKDRQSRRTAEVADRVIDHQMRIVQEIASLLGETAAETKIALTRLKESIDHE